MGRRLGAYAPLSAMYSNDDAIIAAGEAAELLFVRGLAFCAGMPEQDGYITDAQLLRFVGAGMADAADRADTLVREGLWERIDGGYVVRAWLKWNRSSEDLGRERKRDRDRKAAKAAEIRTALGAESAPESAPESSAESDQASDDVSERNPDGIQTESEQSPDGFQPRAPAREAPTGARASGAALHSTPQHSTPPTPAASGEGSEALFGSSSAGDNGSQPCPKHAASLGRKHGNCRDCGTSGRSADHVEDDPEFNEWWKIYPSKVAKGAARAAWLKARKKTSAEVLITAAEAFRDDPRRNPEYTPHPATWLNQERWADKRERRVVPNGSGGWLEN